MVTLRRRVSSRDTYSKLLYITVQYVQNLGFLMETPPIHIHTYLSYSSHPFYLGRSVTMVSALQQLKGCQGILANPDIAGIGIRASTYAQNFLGVFLAACYTMDGEISPDEAEYMEAASNAILMTGCAIIISAFIQAKTIGLSVYHAMIVLNLSWMNNSYLTICWIFTSAVDQTEEQLPAERTREQEEEMISGSLSQRETKKKKILRLPISLGLAHLSIMASFGIWVWQDIDTFGDSPECTPYIFTVIFGRNISAMSKSLRVGSLALYWITAIPSINVVVGGIVAFIIVMIIVCVVTPFILITEDCFIPFIHRYRNRRHLTNSNTNNDDSVEATPKRESFLLTLSYPSLFGLLYLPIVLFIDVLFAVDTELMIHRSRPLIQPGESQWTFGQTLAVIVTIIPVLEARKCFKWWRRPKCVS